MNRGKTAYSSNLSELVEQARSGDPDFAHVPRAHCVEVARNYVKELWHAIGERHKAGESGSNVLRYLTDGADTVVRAAVEFGLYHSGAREKLLSQVAICALGGYGRGELCPHSDLDVCLLYERRLSRPIEALNSFLVPFLWDLGFHAGYTLHSLPEALALSRRDPEVYTTYAQARLLIGAPTVFARLRLLLRGVRQKELMGILQHVRVREHPQDFCPRCIGISTIWSRTLKRTWAGCAIITPRSG